MHHLLPQVQFRPVGFIVNRKELRDCIGVDDDGLRISVTSAKSEGVGQLAPSGRLPDHPALGVDIGLFRAQDDPGQAVREGLSVPEARLDDPGSGPIDVAPGACVDPDAYRRQTLGEGSRLSELWRDDEGAGLVEMTEKGLDVFKQSLHNQTDEGIFSVLTKSER